MPTTTTYPDISSALRHYRESAGLTREQVGAHLGRSVTTIYNWEIGRRTPRLPLLGKLADLYRVTAAELLATAVPAVPTDALRAKVAATRARQGLPPVVVDPAALERAVAALRMMAPAEPVSSPRTHHRKPRTVPVTMT